MIEKTNIIVVCSSHQPNIAKLDKVIDVRKEDGMMLPKDVAETVLCDVNTGWRDWPSGKGSAPGYVTSQ